MQRMDIDIFFIKGMPFLLGVLVPLGLCQVVHLQDRSTGCVTAAVQKMLETARSHFFDCSSIRCDGEGAVSAMRPTLSAAGIDLDVAGPGQHVPVVERAI